MPSATPHNRPLPWICAPVVMTNPIGWPPSASPCVAPGVSTTAALPGMDVADLALMQLALARQA